MASKKKSTKKSRKPVSKKKAQKSEGGSIVRDPFKERYKALSSDKVSCGDTLCGMMAKFLHDEKGAVSPTALASLAKENGIDLGRWSHLNIGQQRMNLGNVLRARVRNGEKVTVGGKPVKKLASAEPKAA